jgi:GNAT superfamily N-acetyltransferase
LALAREYGFPSWARLKAEVERRRQLRAAARRAPRYVLRPVTSLLEVTEAFDLIAAQITPPVTHADRRFRELARRFPEDRALMLVSEDQGRIVGGALAFRKVSQGGSGVTLRIIGLEPSARGHGLGRRLMQALELEAGRLGAPAINLGGASGSIKGFYARLGYAGRGPCCPRDCPCRAGSSRHGSRSCRVLVAISALAILASTDHDRAGSGSALECAGVRAMPRRR